MMAADSSELRFYRLKRPLPPAELLGCVVKEFLDPMHLFTPQWPAQALTATVIKEFLLEEPVDVAHLTSTSADAKVGSFWAKVGGVLGLDVGAAEDGSTDISSPRIFVRRLMQEPAYFDRLKSVPGVHKELLEMCPLGGKVYLVVGTMSYQAATVRQTGARGAGARLGGTLPTGTSAVAPRAASFRAAMGDLGASVQRATSSAWAVQSTVGGDGVGDEERVFAVACREVKRNRLGFGGTAMMSIRQPSTGGQHFGGSDDETDSDEDEDGDGAEPAPADSFCLAGPAPEVRDYETESAIFSFTS